MTKAPIRFASALLWPITIWTSFAHLDEHPADDYVERTTPIAALSVAFWLALAGYVVLTLALQQRIALVAQEDALVQLRYSDNRWRPLADVILYFLPAIYALGLWLFTSREAHFPGTARKA